MTLHSYIHSIRNGAKRQFAWDYLAARKAGRRTESIETPISTMARQAVAMQVDAFLKELADQDAFFARSFAPAYHPGVCLQVKRN